MPNPAEHRKPVATNMKQVPPLCPSVEKSSVREELKLGGLAWRGSSLSRACEGYSIRSLARLYVFRSSCALQVRKEQHGTNIMKRSSKPPPTWHLGLPVHTAPHRTSAAKTEPLEDPNADDPEPMFSIHSSKSLPNFLSARVERFPPCPSSRCRHL